MLDGILGSDKPSLNSSFDSIASTASNSDAPSSSVLPSTTQLQPSASQNAAIATTSTATVVTTTTTVQQQTGQSNSATAPVVANISTPVVHDVTSGSDSESHVASADSCPFHGTLPHPPGHPVHIKTEPGLQIKSEPVDAGYEKSMMGIIPGCRIKTEIKEEPVEREAGKDAQSNAVSLESESDEPSVAIGQSETRPSVPPAAAATSVGNEEQDAETTNAEDPEEMNSTSAQNQSNVRTTPAQLADQDVEPKSNKTLENQTEADAEAGDAEVGDAAAGERFPRDADIDSEDSGICSRPSSRNTPVQGRGNTPVQRRGGSPVQGRRKDAVSDRKLLRAVVLLQRLEDIVRSPKKRKLLQENQETLQEEETSEAATPEQKDETESTDVEPEQGDVVEELESEKDADVTQDETTNSAKKRTIDSDIKEENEETQDKDAEVTTPLKSKTDTDIFKSPLKSGNVSVKLMDLRIVLDKKITTSDSSIEKVTQHNEKSGPPVQRATKPSPSRSVSSAKRSPRRRLSERSGAADSGSDTDEYSAGAEPLITTITTTTVQQQTKRTQSSNSATTVESPDGISETQDGGKISSGTPSGDAEMLVKQEPREETRMNPESGPMEDTSKKGASVKGNSSKIQDSSKKGVPKQEISSRAGDEPSEDPYVCVNLVSGPMKDRRMHLQVGFQPIIHTTRMSEQELAKWIKSEPRDDTEESGKKTGDSQETAVARDSQETAVGGDSRETSVGTITGKKKKRFKGVKGQKDSTKLDDSNPKSVSVQESSSKDENPNTSSALVKEEVTAKMDSGKKGVRVRESLSKKSEQNENVTETKKSDVAEKYKLKEFKIVLADNDASSEDVTNKKKDSKKETTKEKCTSDSLKNVSSEKESPSKDLDDKVSQQKDDFVKDDLYSRVKKKRKKSEQSEDKKESVTDKYRLKNMKIFLELLPKELGLKDGKTTKSKDLQEESTFDFEDFNIVVSNKNGTPSKRILVSEKGEGGLKNTASKSTALENNIFDSISKMRMRSRSKTRSRSRSRSPSRSRSASRSSVSSPRASKGRSPSVSSDKTGKGTGSASEESKVGKKRAQREASEEKSDKRKRVERETSEEKSDQKKRKRKRESRDEEEVDDEITFYKRSKKDSSVEKKEKQPKNKKGKGEYGKYTFFRIQSCDVHISLVD